MVQVLREAARRGEQLGLFDDKLAFYDALEVNNIGDEKLSD